MNGYDMPLKWKDAGVDVKVPAVTTMNDGVYLMDGFLSIDEFGEMTKYEYEIGICYAATLLPKVWKIKSIAHFYWKDYTQ